MVTTDPWMSEPVEPVELLPPEKLRKRKKYRRYPRPECSPAQRAALMELQQGRCAICREEAELFTDHSYRTGKTRGLLCRQHNAALGMFKDSPTLLKRAVAYLQSPPAKALGFGGERERKDQTMSAVALSSEDVDESTGQPIWSLALRCGHTVTCGRFSERAPTQRPCLTCKAREREHRKYERKKARQAEGPVVWRLRNG